MSNDLEMKFCLADMFGLGDAHETSLAESLQKSTDALDGFFERLEIEKSLGHGSTDFSKMVAERTERGAVPNHEPQAVSDLRDFVKGEKKKVPNMTGREMRSSMIHLLGKAADAMAAI